MKPVNPYIVGNPIKDPAGFFGREDIFREVLQVLRQRESNAIVLYGQRRIGKTSVLLQLEKQLRRDGEFMPVYFDLQDKAAKSLTEVLYELSQHISKVTNFPIAKVSDFDRAGDYFRNVFIPEVTQKVSSGGLVLLFDEFDVLDSPMRTQASEAFFPYLRQWMSDVQKVKFVFVIGRRPEDLSVRTMSTFKGIQSTRVSFLSRRDAEDVIRQSEKEGTLKWEEAAVGAALDLSHGHPYFTQLVCSVIWENAYESSPDTIPVISPQAVEKAVLPALKFGANAFNWLWDGLPPAERVVVAAMAEVKDELITQDKLIETLNLSGVRLVARELELAPETLIDWEVLIESGGYYRFAVPLLRRWVLANRPLRRVKEELDRLNPQADGLFQTGFGFYNQDSPNLDAAEAQLRLALNINPNHLKARLLLGQILLEKGNLTESVNMFDAAYQYDERAARADLIKSLLALAETQEESLQLSTYERILKVQSDQPQANQKIRAIWVKRGEAAQAQESYEEALKIFEQIGDTERIEKVRVLMHEKKLALDMQRADTYEKSGQWKLAFNTLTELIPEYPESDTLRSRLQLARINWRNESLLSLDDWEAEENWTKAQELCKALEQDFPDDAEIKSRSDYVHVQLNVTQKYREAVILLESGQRDKARRLLAEVAIDSPTLGQASLKLVEAMYGEVNVSFPIPPEVKLFSFAISLTWATSILIGSMGVLTNLIVNFNGLGKVVFGSYLYVLPATYLVFAIVLIPLISVVFSIYINNAIDFAYRVEQNGPSYMTALRMHVILGMGMFYIGPETRRKWFYTLIALFLSFLIFYQIFLLLTPSLQINQLHITLGSKIPYGKPFFWGIDVGLIEETLDVLLWIFLGLYALSFIDVIGTCYVRRSKSRTTPNPKQVRYRLPFEPTKTYTWSSVSIVRKTRAAFEALPRWAQGSILASGALILITGLLVAIELSDPWVTFLVLAAVLIGMRGAFVILPTLFKSLDVSVNEEKLNSSTADFQTDEDVSTKPDSKV